ncbi:MAG: MFS family permease [Gammaproteobacteria bacterium]|jgi:MFS family permease
MLSLLRREWQLLLFGFLMTFWSAPGQTFLISLFSGEIRADLQLTDGEFAGYYSLATLTSAVVIIWSGSLIDRIDLKTLSIGLVIMLAVGCGLISLMEGIPALIISLFILRHIGQGLMTMTSATSMVRYLDANKGKASAIAGMGYAVAEAIMPVILVSLVLWFGWRVSWQIIGLVLLLSMLPAICFLLHQHRVRHSSYVSNIENSETDSNIKRQKQWRRSEVIRDKWFYLFMPGLIAQPLMFTGFIFHQVHLVEEKGWTLTSWAALFSIYAIVSVVTKLFAGIIIDKVGAIRLVFIVALPMSLGLFVLALSNSLTAAAIFLILTGVTVGLYSTLSAPFLAEMYGTLHLGSIKSFSAAIMVLSTAVSPIIIGWQIDLGRSMDELAFISALIMLLSSLMAWFAARYRPDQA